MKRNLIIVFLIGLAFIGVSGFLISRETAKQNQITQAEELGEKAFELASEARPGNFSRRLLRILFPKIAGHSVREEYTRKLLTKLLKGFPQDSFTLFLVDSREELLWSSKNDPFLWETTRERLCGTWLRQYGLPIPVYRYARLTEKPGTLVFWRTNPFSPLNTVAGVIIAIDVMKITRDRILKQAILREQRPGGSKIGLWDLVEQKGTALPTGIDKSNMHKLIERFSRHEGSWIASESRIIAFHPIDGTKILLGLVEKPHVLVDPLILLILLFWILIFGLTWNVLEANKISLKAFLGLSLGISAGIPLFLTLVFWFFFEKNRVESLVSNELKTMEQRLIQLDNQLPETRRRRRQNLRELTKKLESHVGSMSSVLTEAGLMEMQHQNFDCFFLINSQGVNLRDWSMLDPALKHIAPLPLDQKMYRIPELLSNSEMLNRPMVELAIKLKVESGFLPEFWKYKTSQEHTRKAREGLGVLGKILIFKYNQMTGKAPNDEKNAGKSDMLYGAVIDSQTGDILQVVLANLGDMLRMGSGKLSCWVFIDVIKDFSGVAQFLSLFFIDMSGVENDFLEKLFSNRKRWPRNCFFSAESWVSPTFFPIQEKKHSLRRHFDRLSPPKVLYSKVISKNNHKVLMSAYAARNMNNFVLFARRPWSIIEEDRMKIIRQMAVIFALMFLLMMGISWRIYQGIIAPANALMRGVEALENKRFSHSIPRMTGDEWDDLVDSFNNAIQGMEELQVASVVQSLILPSGLIRGKAGCFMGRSIMTGQVGGDYFDAIVDDDGSINFVIGDVAGHGVSAALVVAMAKSSFNIIYRSGIRSPAKILERMNHLMLSQLAKKKSLTMQAGRLTADGKLILCNAGHPFPYIMTTKMGIQEISLSGLPLGLIKKAKYVDSDISVLAPAMLVLYTDGIVEQFDSQEVRFGFSRLETELKKRNGNSPEELIAGVHQALRMFSGDKPWDDDITLVCIQISPQC
ncbi:MAG: PP2C family protein-serine/threonine phosphatase [Candidatus Riflebacteria bacterium]|nr:PP2C family protein-serine/threonine phosphatase [Candidatus Riflebacteria bacterium]